MQRGQFKGVVLSGVGLLHLAEDLFEGSELAFKDIGLVHLVGHNNKGLLGGKLNDRLDVVGREHSTSGVSRVDDHNGLHINSFGDGFFVSGLNRIEVCSPGIGFVENVWDALGIKDGQSGRVQWVLGDWDKYSGIRGSTDDMEQSVDSRGGTSSEIDVVRVGRVAVASCEG